MTPRALLSLTTILAADGRRTVRLDQDENAWMEILELANAHLLAPALHGRIAARENAGDMPADVLMYLSELHDLNRRRNGSLHRQCEEIVAAFNDNGIVPILLKGGIALYETDAQRFGERMMRDLDLLVRRRDVQAAKRALEELGYYILNAYPEGHHAVAEFARAGDVATVDLHTELVDPSYVLPAERVMDRAVRLMSEAGVIYAPCPTDRILHHVLHAQVHYLANFYRAELDLGQVHDFWRMIAVFDAEIDWPEIERRMRKHRLAVPLHAYLLATRRLLGMDWPLATRGAWLARFESRLAVARLVRPWLGIVMVPLGNLRRGFAWHRMRALYGPRKALVAARVRHAAQFLHKKSAIEAIAKIFRTQ